MFLRRHCQVLLACASTAANIAAGYFPYPFYIGHFMNKFADKVVEAHALAGDATPNIGVLVDTVAFRISASKFSLTGVLIGLCALGLAWLCKKQGLAQFWRVGRICACYCIVLLGLMVLLMWLQLSYEYWGALGGAAIRLGFIFSRVWI